MARPSKRGSYFNCYLNTQVYDETIALSKMLGITRTCIVEDAIRKYLMQFKDADGNLSGYPAVLKIGASDAKKVGKEYKRGMPCFVLDDRMTMFGEPYTKVFANGSIITVPSNDVIPVADESTPQE